MIILSQRHKLFIDPSRQVFIPKILIRNITSVHGEQGQQWLTDLPNLLQVIAESWSLRVGDCYAEASFNYVAPVADENGRELVLKCGVPSQELVFEATALKYFNGVGAVRLLEFSATEGVMLMERIIPGHLLEALTDEDQATWQAIEVMKKLHQPMTEPSIFPTISDWLQGLEKCAHSLQGLVKPVSAHLVDKAKGISRELLSSMGEQVLLHGDLHYANMIWSEQNGYVAIDPKGVIGEREYEIPLPRLQSFDRQLLLRKLDRFIEFSGFDRQKIICWLFCKAVLAAWWTFEDTGMTDKKFIQCAEEVEKLGLETGFI